ncbi:MAG: ABC transporter substrate-binding protein, partial [bacterium]
KNGLLDIGIPGIATPAKEIGGRAPLSIVGGAASKSAALVVPKSTLETFAEAGDPVAKVGLLRGKKIGAVRGSTGLAIFQQALVRAGLNEKDLELREFSKPSEIISSLANGNLEAGLLWSPHMTLAEGRGLGIALWMSDILPEHVCCRQIARDEFLEDPVAIVEYLVGILKADMLLRRSRSDPELRSKLMTHVRRYLTTLTEKQLELELFSADPRTTVSPDLDRQGIEDYLKAMETAGLMRGDQCANVREKIRPDFMQAAYRRLGCKAPIARNCVDKRAAECECASPP